MEDARLALKPDWVPRWMWRLGDAFAPDPVNRVLYTPIIDTPFFYINGWHFVHLGSGVLVKLYGLDAYSAFWLHCLWEVFQYSIGMTPENWIAAIDVVIDTAFFMLPYAV